MKRSGPLRRLTPLRARTPLRRTEPSRLGQQLRRSKIRRTYRAVPKDIVLEVHERDRSCRAARLIPDTRCFGPADPHHLRRRSQGGTDTPENLILVCRAHHDWIHQHPRLAHDLGLLRRSGDE